MTTAKVIRRAIRDVDGLNAEAARQLESAIMSRYVYDQSMTIDHLDDIMGVVDEVLSPVYGRDRVRAARSSMFQAIVRNGQIAADESYLRPFHEMDIRLYERFGDDWSRIRSRMIRQKGYFPNALAAIGGDQKAVRRLNLRRKKLFDPQRRWVDPRGYRLSDRIWKQGVLHRRNIDKVLKRGIKRGDGPVTIAKELREYLDPAAAPLSFRRDGRILRRKRARGRFRDGQGASAARRLARTEVQRVAHDATVQSVRDLREDIPRAAVIYALSPSHPRIDVCDSLAQGSSRGYPPGVYLPDEVPSIPHPNCTVAGTLVSGPLPVGGTKRWYDGDLIHISTEGGRHLAITPNHPVLTDQGWVPAGELGVGQNLICDLGAKGLEVGPDDYYRPAVIEDVLESLGGASGMSTVRVPSSPEQFHGDGSVDGEVNIVGADGLLHDDIRAALAETFGNEPFTGGDVELAFLSREGGPAFGLEGDRPSAFPVLSVLGHRLALGGVHAGEGELLGLGAAPDRHAALDEELGDDAAADAVALADRVDGFAVGVAAEDRLRLGTDRVRWVHRQGFAGHVYNLQTTEEWYIANGIVTHNCLCSRRPWVPSREEVLRDLEKKYGTRSPRARIISDDEWEYRGDGVYEWDATQWGDDVGWEKGFNDALDLGMSEEQAYRLAYEDAKNGYFTQRSDDLNEFFGFHYDDGSGWPLVTVDGDGVRDLWRMSANDLADRVADPRIRTDWGIVDDTIDEAITNSRRSINFLMENMEDWDDLAPSFELTGGRKIGSAAADYGLDSNTIRINLTDRSWFGRDLPLDDGVPSGYVHRFTVAESPEGFLVHEYGHTRHMTDLQRHGMIDWVQDWDDPSKWYYRMTDWDGVVREFGEDSLWDGWETAKERLIATRVSNYAAYDPLEFVAETHTALIQGERFGDDVMDLYRQLGGKIPAQSEIDNWALAAGREVDYSDDAFDFADDLFDDGEVWDRLGISQSDYDDLVERGIKQGAITDVDLFDDMTDDVDFMRRVMGDLDGPPRPEPRAKLRSLPEEPWERSGDGNDYDWDTTNWGDSVAFRKEFDRINDRNERLLASGDDIEEWEIQWDAYGAAYRGAREEHLRERRRDVTEWFDHRAGGDASISFGGHHDMVDFWSRTDDEMDRYFNNVFDGTSVIRNLDGFPSDRLNVDIDIADLRRRGYDDVDIGSVIDSNKVFRIKPSQYGESGSHSGGLMRDDWGSISISDKWDELFVRDMKVSPSPDYLREMVSGESPPLMLVHEFGHGLHKANLKTFANPKSHGNPLDGTLYIEITARDGRRIRLGYGGARTSELYPEKAGAILREVSRYADSDPMEFVAETYTGLLTGERYSDEVMELFDLLGGVEPSLKDRQLWREFERARRKSGYNEVDRDRRTPARNVDPQVDPSDENPYDDWAGDDVFPDTSGMTEEEVANMMGWTSEEFDDVIYYGIDRDLFDDDDIIVFDEFEVLGEWEGIPPAPILQMVKDIMELEENSAGKRWWE